MKASLILHGWLVDWRRWLKQRPKVPRTLFQHLRHDLAWEAYDFVMGLVCFQFHIHPLHKGHKLLHAHCPRHRIPLVEYQHRRKRSVVALSFIGIAGVSLLKPLFPTGSLPLPHLKGEEWFDGTDWEVRLETPTGERDTHNGVDDRFVRLGGWLAVWQRQSQKGWQVVLYDAKTVTEEVLTDEQGDHLQPQTDGRFVVWQERREDVWSIMLYDREQKDVNKSILRISDGKSNALRPRISEGVVTWHQWMDSHYEIMVWDRQRGFRQLTDTANVSINPTVLGSIIVWQEIDAHHHSRLKIHDLAYDKEEYLLTDENDPQFDPVFEEQNLSWFVTREGKQTTMRYNFGTGEGEEKDIATVDEGLARTGEDVKGAEVVAATASSTTPVDTATTTEPVVLVPLLETSPAPPTPTTTTTTEERPVEQESIPTPQ